MEKHPADTYNEIMTRLFRKMPRPKWLNIDEAADHLENLYPRTDPVYLTKQIRDTALAILDEYPRLKSALHLLSACNVAIDSGDFCRPRIRAIISAYRGISPKAWAAAKGGYNKAKKHEAEKRAARRKAKEIWAYHKRKPSIRQLWGLVVKALYPKLSEEALEKKSETLRTGAILEKWKPSD